MGRTANAVCAHAHMLELCVCVCVCVYVQACLTLIFFLP